MSDNTPHPYRKVYKGAYLLLSMTKNKIKVRKKTSDEYYWECPHCDKVVAHETESSVKYNKKIHLEKHKKEEEINKK